jgi:hypothetical protein
MPDPMSGDVWRGRIWRDDWRIATAVVTVCSVTKSRVHYRTCNESTLWSIKRSQWDKWAETAELVNREGAR